MSIAGIDDKGSIKQSAGPVFSWGNAPLFIIAALVVLLCIYVRVRLLGVPLERDEGEYAYIGQLMLKGIPPFAAAYSMKLPGIYGMYALMMALLGQTAQGIHLGLLIANLITIFLLFLLGRRICDIRAGAAASAVYALLSVSNSVLGVFAHATHFVVLFAMAGFLCLFAALDRDSRLLVLVTGFLFGMAVTMKQHAALITLFALLFLTWKGVGKGVERRKLIGFALLFTVGAFLPYLGWAVYLYAEGVFGRFWFWTVQYAAEYATNIPFDVGRSIFFWQVEDLVTTTSFLWIAAIIQLFLLVIGRVRRVDRFFLIGLFLSCFAAVVPGYYFRSHYFVMLLPAISLLVGTAVSAVSGLPGSRSARKSLLRISLAVALFVLLCSPTIVQERQYLFLDSPRQVSAALYPLTPFPESQAVAAYLKANTSPSDRIAILGSEPQLYFYADRLSVSGHIYMYGLMEEQPFAGRMQDELIHDIVVARPKFIVVATMTNSWLFRPGSERKILVWAEDYLSRNYNLVGVVNIVDQENREIFWGNDALLHERQSPDQLLVYRAKE